MITIEKEKQMNELMAQLNKITVKGIELDEYDRGLYDVLSWLIGGSTKPTVELDMYNLDND
jgi:hypothetical protein